LALHILYRLMTWLLSSAPRIFVRCLCQSFYPGVRTGFSKAVHLLPIFYTPHTTTQLLLGMSVGVFGKVLLSPTLLSNLLFIWGLSRSSWLAWIIIPTCQAKPIQRLFRKVTIPIISILATLARVFVGNFPTLKHPKSVTSWRVGRTRPMGGKCWMPPSVAS